jgi:hypothetical protein
MKIKIIMVIVFTFTLLLVANNVFAAEIITAAPLVTQSDTK